MNKYGSFSKFKIRQGKREELTHILLSAAQFLLTTEGCQQYIIYNDVVDQDVVWVSEIWDTREHHDRSLKLEESMVLISKAFPLIEGKPENKELTVIGGIGFL